MRKLLLGCALALFATSASAGGIYQNSTSADTPTGLPNVATTLWSTNIPGTGVSQDNAMLIHVSTYANGLTQTGTIKIKLNGTQIGPTVAVYDAPVDIDLRVTRLSSGFSQTAAWVSGTITYHDGVVGALPIAPSYVVNGLGWGSQQALTIVGQSDETNGVHLNYAGVQR